MQPVNNSRAGLALPHIDGHAGDGMASAMEQAAKAVKLACSSCCAVADLARLRDARDLGNQGK